MKSSELKDKKILILGFGREGQDTLKLLKKLFPKKQIDVADQKSDKNYLKKIGKYDVVIKSPGIPFKKIPKIWLQKITTPTAIFFDNCPAKIIGVTGTKGKSTTASMIHDVLNAGGIKNELVGNIGKPVLHLLGKPSTDRVFVYELSSFQLTNLKKSPHIAVLLNIYPEHLDYYRNFSEYFRAKANITKYQTKSDYLVYNAKNERVREIARTSQAKKIPVDGKYYDLDIAAAKQVGKIFQIAKDKINEAINNFKFLPHRLEYVGKFKGITFYNDSLATVPEATIGALEYLGDNVQTLMLGGFDRGLDFQRLAKSISQSKVKTLILFPPSGERILSAITEGFPTPLKRFNVKNMKDAVKMAYRHTEKGKICLLSPASPSFGIFRDYADRGDQFKKFVRQRRNATINT